MRRFGYLLLLILTGQSCALLDGYKDNQHSAYSRQLTSGEKARLDAGETIEKNIKTLWTTGTLLVAKGDPEFGKYNFVEVGDWKEFFEYSSGNFHKGDMKVETRYDAYGNILARTVLDRTKGDDAFYTYEIWTSKMEAIENDSILTQNIKTFTKDKKQREEFNLAIVNYKERLSDRLKTKIKAGPERTYDPTGALKKETVYLYKDGIKSGR